CPAGRTPHTGSFWSRAMIGPSGAGTTRICYSPGATYAVSTTSGAPSSASTTRSALIESSRSARLRVNLAGMCCTTSTAAPHPGESRGTTSASARGPPADAASATTHRARARTAGSNWCTLRTASNPSRAVAITSNPRSTSLSTRRIRALSSTTRTRGVEPPRSDDDGIAPHGPDLDVAVDHVEADGAARAAAHGLARQRDGGGAQGVARGDDVALAHLHAARRHQLGEHARPARELRDEAPGVGPERPQPLDEERHRSVGKLRGIGGVVREAARRQQDVGHPPGAGGRVVQHDGDAGPEPERDDDRIAALRGPLRHLYDGLLRGGTHAGRR